ncbi:MAG: hypothetical protein CSA72_09445 [Rhodobacterales bacterium]|nr:MAG: hypothetical protein CSA72_09445 [Rhodobacterales bacterium]
MEYFILPTLLTVGLLWWLFDDDDDGDDNDNSDGDDGDQGGDENVETISLTAASDLSQSGTGSQSVSAGDGNDMVSTGAGDDSIYGQVGADVLAGGDANDLLRGGEGKDYLNGGNGDDKLFGDSGDDIIGFSGVAQNLDGDDNAEYASARGLDPAALDAFLSSSALSDGGNDTIHGGPGDDTIGDFAGDNMIYGQGGADTLTAFDAGAGAGEGVDTLDGGVGHDLLRGDDGDILIGGDNTDSFDVLVQEADDRPVQITDLQPGETVRVAVEGAPDGSDLTFTPNGSMVDVYFGDHLVATVSSDDDAMDAAAISAAISIARV